MSQAMCGQRFATKVAPTATAQTSAFAVPELKRKQDKQANRGGATAHPTPLYLYSTDRARMARVTPGEENATEQSVRLSMAPMAAVPMLVALHGQAYESANRFALVALLLVSGTRWRARIWC
jgi:hypothetical protein